MKKLFFLLLISIGINSFAQDTTDISKLPATVPYTWSFPWGERDATVHGAFAYDTLKLVIPNKYGIEQDPITGKYLNDVHDTLYIQRKYDFSYTPEGVRNNVTYKMFTLPKK